MGKWKRSFDYFIVGTGVTNTARKRALLFHHVGQAVQDRFVMLRDDNSIVDVYERAVKALGASFAYAPNKCSCFECFQLCSMCQHSGDSVSQFEV